MLSFLGEEDEEEEPAAAVGCVREVDNKRGTLEKRGGEESRGRSAMGKDPSVSTSFLPDAAREAAEAALRQEAKVEWLKLQETIKAEALNVVYSYWDGAGHRREVTITKGYSIGKFCEAARADLVKEFPELRALSASSLIYVKEDLIIPHHYTFYELISTGARGKSGPLFSFDVHDDVRLVMDARAEKDESHPGKILDARWYQRNKHIFPYNRWEVFDPKVERDKYTIK
jgi:protein FAM50